MREDAKLSSRRRSSVSGLVDSIGRGLRRASSGSARGRDAAAPAMSSGGLVVAESARKCHGRTGPKFPFASIESRPIN